MRFPGFALFLLPGLLFAQAIVGPSNPTSNPNQINVTTSWLYLNKMHWAGAWSSAATYNAQDVVTYSGLTYVSLQVANLNQTPSSSPSWWAQVVVSGLGFNGITTGTNTSAAMTVGSGASLAASGTGTIAATGLGGQTYYTASATANLGTIADGDCAQVAPFTLSGAAVGDMVFAGSSVALPAGVNVIAKVTAANTVAVEVCNLSEASQTVGPATYKVALLH